MITPAQPPTEKTLVDTNNAKLQRLREEEEAEEQRRAQLDYARHMREIHPRKRQRCDEEFDEEGEPFPPLEDEEDDLEPIDMSAKRIRSIDRETDSNWYAEASPDGTKSTPVPIMYRRQKELESLKEFSAPDEGQRRCYACSYMAVAAHASIYAEDWKKVVEFYQATLPSGMNHRDWGLELFEFFDKTVGESLRKQGELQEGETVWSPFGILDHFLNHNKDPVVQKTRDFWALSEIESVIVNNEMFLMDPVSGRVTTSENAIKKLKIVMEMRDKIMQTNPYRLPFATQEVNAASSSKEVAIPYANPYSQMRQRTRLAEVQSRWKA